MTRLKSFIPLLSLLISVLGSAATLWAKSEARISKLESEQTAKFQAQAQVWETVIPAIFARLDRLEEKLDIIIRRKK